MTRLPSPWLRPTVVDPDLIVNREEEFARYGQILSDYVEDEEPNALILLRGDRGIGKSIFGRRLVANLASAFPERVIPIVLDHRGADERAVLRRFLELFVKSVPKPLKDDSNWHQEWLVPLQQLFAAGDRMVHSVSEGSGRIFGASSEVSGGLWGVLQGKFGANWKQNIDVTRRTDYTVEVTEDVLRAAIIAALETVSKIAAVVVFFDDLDQARRMDSPEAAKGTLRNVLDLRPCLKLVHLRTEYGYTDWRREVDVTIDLEGMPADILGVMLRKRAERTGGQKEVLAIESNWAPLNQLAKATDNPLVLLRWAQALATCYDAWPPPPGWTQPDPLRNLVVKALNGPDPEPDLLRRLGCVLDRLDRRRGFCECDLERGCPELDAMPAQDRIDSAEIAWLCQYELLIPVNRDDPKAGLRADPLLDLLRPSIASRLPSAP